MTPSAAPGRPAGGIVFVTSNEGKALEAGRFLGRPVAARPFPLAEVQSLSFEEVVRAKALEAALLLGEAVLVDDSGLSLPSWNGYPGPFTRWTLEASGLELFARIVDLLPDRRAEAVAALALARPGDGPGDVVVVTGRVPGTIASSPRGTNGFGWDPLFVPAGQERTWGEMAAEEKDRLSHRGRAFEALRALLGPLRGA